MRKLLLIPAFAVLALGSAIPALAGHQNSCGYQGRQASLQNQLHQSLKRGEINWEERRYLSRELASLQAMERHFQADGRIDGREQRMLNHRYTLASQHLESARTRRQDQDRYSDFRGHEDFRTYDAYWQR